MESAYARTRARIRSKDIVAQLMFLPSLVVIALFTFYPIAWAFVSSFKSVSVSGFRRAAFYEIPGKFNGLANYAAVLRNGAFLSALGNTAKYALLNVPTTLGAAMVLAVLLRKKMAGVSFFRTAFFVPYVVSLVSASLIFLTLFDGQSGIMNYLLGFLGLKPRYWMADSFWAMAIIALLGVWLKTGYYMLFFLAGLQNIPDELYEAARMDGAGAGRQFLSVTLPSLRPIVLVVLVLLLRDVLIVFQEVYVMTGGGPANSTTTVAFLIYREAFSNLRIGSSSAMSFVLVGIAVCIAWLQARLLRET
jgi:multiple sugar transport system permease protein